MASFKKTRIAPTPSGFLHLGNAYSFLLTAQLAKQCEAKILLRIDDLDRERVEEAYVQDIFETLHFLGINWQEGPKDIDDFELRWSQLHRMAIYNEALQQLNNKGLVFACTCSRTQILNDSADGAYPGTCKNKNLPLDTPGASWRLNTSEEINLQVKTWEGGSIERTLPRSMKDFIIRKKDGFPAYQLSSVVDDVQFDIDIIIRGQDLWNSTLAQLYLASLLNFRKFTEITFLHHNLIEASPGQKLSKSAGDTSVQYLRKQGMSRKEMYKMLQLPFDVHY